MLWIVIVGAAFTLWPVWWLVKVFLRGLCLPTVLRQTVKVTTTFEGIVKAEVSPEQWQRIINHWSQVQPLL